MTKANLMTKEFLLGKTEDNLYAFSFFENFVLMYLKVTGTEIFHFLVNFLNSHRTEAGSGESQEFGTICMSSVWLTGTLLWELSNYCPLDRLTESWIPSTGGTGSQTLRYRREHPTYPYMTVQVGFNKQYHDAHPSNISISG